jgi:tetratricopeptide (TPR) repeat protein
VLTLGTIETVAKEERQTYRWLVDRFTKIYLDDWALQSLYLEWRYLHAELVAPCSSAEMRQRRIADSDVSKAIASRVAPVQKDRRDQSSDENEPSEAPGLSIDQLVSAAAEFLQAGRRSAAAALFEAAKRGNPDNAEVRNNYGFCILPDNPEDGLQEILAAEALGFTPRSVNLANRMYGLFLLRRYASALEVAERLFQEDDHEALLWDWRKDPENTTVLNVNARPYAIQFALDIAQATGDSSQANLWAARAEALGLGSKA